MGFALLVLTLIVCMGLFLPRSPYFQAAVVHGADDAIKIKVSTNKTATHASVCTASQINADEYSTLNITTRADITMVTQSSLLGTNDYSEIQAYIGATIHLHGKIRGTFERLSISNSALFAKGHFYIHLYDGAVFSAVYDPSKTLSAYDKDIECIGCNFGSNITNNNVTVVNDSGKDIKYSTSVPADGQDADGHFNQNIPGTIYTFTAPEDSQVVWTKGRGGAILTNESGTGGNDVTVVSDRQVKVSCRGNAKYQVYAFFVPEPEWTWNDDNTASVKVYSYDPNNTTDLTSYKIYDANSVPPVTTEVQGNGYLASVTIDGKTYQNQSKSTSSTTAPGNTGGATDPSNTGGATDPSGTNNTDNYKFTADSVWSWKQGSTGGMPVVVKKTVGDSETIINNLVSVSVDGAQLTRNTHYTADPGSIKITLLPSYLKTLSIGKHTLTVKMTDGTLQDTFTISASGGSDSDDPGKGDSSPRTGEGDGLLIFYTWLVIFSFAVVYSLIVWKKKTKRAYR